jgi:Kinesin motor domain
MATNRQSITVSDTDKSEMDKTYRFSKILSDEADQKTVFTNTMVNMLQDLFHKGKGGLVFSYGNSGSGKTFTMIGNENHEEMGIIPRTANFILEVKNSINQSRIDSLCENSALKNDGSG